MSHAASTEKLIAELYAASGKAEIVDGRVVMMSPTGDMPSSAAGAMFASLRQFARSCGSRAYPDNIAYMVDLPNRKSFSPDASYYTGPRSQMKFLPQPPDFAAEVRSEGDYGASVDQRLVRKRKEYFEAGTLVVWDVNLLGADVVCSYRAEAPDRPVVFRSGMSPMQSPQFTAGRCQPTSFLNSPTTSL